MKDLQRIKEDIISNGCISLTDVHNMYDVVYTDGKVNKDEAEFLFDIRKGTIAIANPPEWDEFFIKAICDFILDDDRSSDAVDEIEARWLVEQIGDDNIIDEVEERLLNEIHRKAKHFPKDLETIQKHTNIPAKLGKKILRMLCGSSISFRSLQTGVTKNGEIIRKNPFSNHRTLSEDDDEDHEN